MERLFYNRSLWNIVLPSAILTLNMKILKAFLPLLVFVILYLGGGIYFHLQGVDFAFYQIPGPVAAIPGVLLAIYLATGTLDERIETFIKGMGNSNILTMCLIYLLAGSFSVLMTTSGGVDAAVQLGLHYIPSNMIIPGIFVLSALISFAMGTSMGTISAIGPIAFGLVSKTGIDVTDIFGAVIGGAMFGDNLSFISDTTIAATKTQGAEMRDKFIANSKLAFPAAVLTIIYFATIKTNGSAMEIGSFEWPKIIPYALIFITAILGMNVFLVLVLGIISASIMSFVYLPDYNVIKLSQGIFQGFKDMQEIFILSLLMGGLGEMLKVSGGIKYMRDFFQSASHKLLRNKKPELEYLVGELTIASSVVISNTAVANNTVAILICSDFAREVATKEKITPARSASILDVFSCVTQGILPYGAQILLGSQLAGVSPLMLAGSIYYCYFLLGVTLISMFVLYFKKAKQFHIQ